MIDTCPENISSWEREYMLRNANKRVAVICEQLHKYIRYVCMIIKIQKLSDEVSVQKYIY